MRTGFVAGLRSTDFFYSLLAFVSTLRKSEGMFALVLLAALQPAVSGATAVGAIPGSHEVSPTGAFTYAIPLAVPPGTAGLEPKLSLEYSSQSGNGLLGVGWSLGGLSAISRCPADPAPNTSVRIAFASADRFCLDGQKLVAVSGTYGANGTEYRAQRESFVKVVSNGTAGSGPASFKVWTKAGLIMEYGVSTDSRILAEGKAEARVWALNKVSDTVGNYFTITYVQDATNADYAPTRIDYTGNAAAGVATYNKVELAYESRSDSSTGYVAGARIGQVQRLTHVRAYVGTTLVIDYALEYDSAPVTKRSRLVSLTRCAGDGSCLAATRFTWSDGELASYAQDSETATVSGTSNDILYGLGDLNADGKTDALLFDFRNKTFTPYLASSVLTQGESTAVMFGYQSMLPNKSLLLADANGDGTADASIYFDGVESRGGRITFAGVLTWYSNMQGVSSPTPQYASTLTPSGDILFGMLPWVASRQHWVTSSENDADGRADVLIYYPDLSSEDVATTGTNEIGFITTSSDSAISYGVGVADSATPAQSFFITGDITGDGLTDAVRYTPSNGGLRVWQSNGSAHNVTPLSQTLSVGGSPADRWFQLADINGDGLGDLVLHTPANGQVRTWLAKGDGTFVAGSISGLSTGGLPADTWFQMVDINADGRADAVKYNPTSGNLTYALSLGDGGFDAVPTTVFIGTGPLPTPNIGSAPYTQWFSPADVNGDGVLDWVRFNPVQGRIKVNLGQGGVADQLLTITNGLGAETRIVYKPLTDSSVYTKGTGAVYPEQDVQNAMQVVASVESSNGLGGFARNAYTYTGLKAKVDGGGLLGFKTMAVRDEQSGITTTTEYRQDSPYTGQVAKVTRTTASGTVIGQTTNTWTVIFPGNITAYAYLQRAIDDSFDLNGVRIGRVQTDVGQDSYGNLLNIWKRYYAPADLTNPVKTEWTSNTYDNLSSSWLLGRLKRAVVQDYATAMSRVSSFEYDATTGLLTKETIEPDQPQYRLDTAYTYDAFGNRKTVSVSSPATGTAAIASRSSSVTYDANGQFPTGAANALGHTETKVFDPKFGVVTSLTGPNGLATTWQYDGFGRKTQENRADGTQTVWNYLECDAACPANGVYRIVTQVYGGGIQTAPASVAYYDSLNREIRTATQGFDGTWIYKDTVYDSQGRVEKLSRPYFAGQAVYWTRSEYDDLGRLLKVFEPDDPDTPVLSVAYSGLSTSRTNRKGQVTTETRNSQGQKASVTDAVGNVTAYAYDPFGNLVRTTDPAGNQIVNLYDLRGRKTQTADPDLGTWTYEYNALGELVKQTDAKAQVTTLVYDKLGRMTQRVEPGMTSTWTWDTAAYGKGKLQSAATSAGYLRSQYYDNKGRPQTTIYNHGAGNPLFVSSLTYDGFGRLSQQNYPNGLVLKTVYNAWGYVAELRNNATNALYWRADAMDAEGRVVRETAGNGVVTERGYQADNGHLLNIVANTAGGQQIQGNAYVYDTIGNVTIVADAPGNQVEIRGGYDSLNRLTQTDIIVNGVTTQQNLSYDALGNILTKTGVGTYVYGNAQHKHAVTQAGSNAYTYDANGNLTGGAGRSLAWTAWNMPASQTQGGQTTAWTYGPEHDRYKMVASGRTTWYLNPGVQQGGHYEKTFYASGTVEHRVTLYGGGRVIGEVLTFEVASGTAPPAQTRYFHSDGQGSITAVTSSTGVVLTRFRYDPWGKQTLAYGSNTGIDATRQGHTGHEMLDGGLTHMNGRLYDPVLARFVSADPHIDNPFDLQSLNRYSYVNNNPLGYTDPSGYFKLFGKKWSWWRDKVVKPVVAIAVAWNIGPMVFNSVFNATLAATGSMPMAGSLWVSSIAAGAASGAVVGGVTGGIFNGPEGIWQGMKYGAIGGAVMGPVTAMYSVNCVRCLESSGVSGAARYGYSLERVAVQSVAGGISSRAQGRSFVDGLKSSFIPSALTYMAVSMRASMWDQSQLDSRNSSGESGGLMGDGHKLGGGRFNPLNPDAISPLGGRQGQRGFLGFLWNNEPIVGDYYAPNSWQDRLVEAYAGPHDWLNSGYWYNEVGNAINRAGVAKIFGEMLNGLNVIPASAFAGASVVQPYNYSSIFGR